MLRIEGDTRAASRLIDGITDRLENSSMLHALAGEWLTDYEEQVFNSNGFGRWPALQPATVAAKGSSRILVASGTLLAALTGDHEVEGDDDVVLRAPAYMKPLAAKGRPAAPTPGDSLVADWATDLLAYLVDGDR